jgi:anti-sigma28 factor (negative regulator of flagellin synthesis)
MKQYPAGLLVFLFIFSINAPAFSQQKIKQKDDKAKVKMSEGKMKMNEMKMQDLPPLDTSVIEKITGIKGKTNNGEYKVTIPQNDLSIEVDGFKIIPAMGLGTWIDFAPSADGAMIMGDIIVTEADLKPVQREIIHQGLTISAIHNHFVRNHPNVMYMHLGGSGSLEQIAQEAKAVLDKIKEVRGGDPSKGKASVEAVENTLDTKKLDEIIGYKAEMSKGVYKYTIGRPDVDLREHGIKVTTFMGFNTWAAWQGSPERAAVAGDFTMLENEVSPVIKALVENGIEVVAVHNHMVHEQPKIFFLHYWGVGNAEQLARGLRAALDQTGKKNPMSMGGR